MARGLCLQSLLGLHEREEKEEKFLKPNIKIQDFQVSQKMAFLPLVPQRSSGCAIIIAAIS